MKKMWENQGEKVLYIKSMRFDTDKNGQVSLIPKALKERYEQIFETPVSKDKKNGEEILKNLFSAIDVKNFGATFAEEGNNISITGAVQFGQGFNKYEGTEPCEQSILSPFRDPKAKEKSNEGEEAKNSTLGTKIVSNEAHYFYSFSINPLAYKEYEDLKVTDGYTEEDYKKFKSVAISSATSYATNSKAGCENEFALFVETEEDLYLPNLAEYITFEKEDQKNIIKIECSELLNQVVEKIKAIEIYYNPYTTVLNQDIKNAKIYNIFTEREE